MVKKKTNYGFSEHYGVLGVIALVAIVAVVALMSSGPSAPSQGLSLDDSNVVGSARYDIAHDSYEINGERYVREERREPAREEVDMSKYVDISLYRESDIKSEYSGLEASSFSRSEVLSALEVESISPSWGESGYSAAIESGGCFTLTTSMFDAPAGTSFTLDQPGMCFKLENNVDVGSGTFFLKNDVELDCQGNELLGSGSVVLYDDAVVRNCVVSNRGNGFVLFDDSQVHNSVAENNYHDGFILHNSAIVDGSISRNNQHGVGYRLFDSSSVRNSISDNHNHEGIVLWASSSVSNSSVSNALKEGFILHESATVTDSIAFDNSFGFILKGSSFVANSVSEDNRWAGFQVQDRSSVDSSISQDNGANGYFLSQSSSVENSVARRNSRNGFFLLDSSSAINSFSEDNGEWGYRLRAGSSVDSSTAEKNARDGFFLEGSARLVSSISRDNGWSGVVVYSNDALVSHVNSVDNYLLGLWVPKHLNTAHLSGKFCNNSLDDIQTGCTMQQGILDCGRTNGRFQTDAANYGFGSGRTIASCVDEYNWGNPGSGVIDFDPEYDFRQLSTNEVLQ